MTQDDSRPEDASTDASPDLEATEPLSLARPSDPPPSWVPPAVQAPPYRAPQPPPYPPRQWPSYPPPGTRPLPSTGPSAVGPAHAAPRGRVPGWVWPVVCVLALVVGVLGGAVGGLAYERLSDGGPGTVSNGLAGVDTASAPPLPADNGSIAAVAHKLLPSTVQISAEYQGQKGGATGSGFVLDRQGHVVTNNHVVEDAAGDDGPIEVVDEAGNRYPATVVGRSPVYDLAVLYAPKAKGFTPAALGSSRGLRVGDQVVAFGSPLGLSSTVTSGIVSALNRPVTTSDSGSTSSYINAVQTDAAINPGNSGGPLVDLSGRVVGVNSAIATTGSSGTGEAGNIGVGFAIPIDQVKITADQILRTGRARYPVIGASVNTGDTRNAGARVLGVTAGSPAADAGMRKGDLVTEVAGEKVPDGIALIVAIRAHQPGEIVPFTVERGGSLIRLRITLGSQVG